MAEIQTIKDSHSESESSLRTILQYTNMTAKTVQEALVQKNWSEDSLPSVRTISNLQYAPWASLPPTLKAFIVVLAPAPFSKHSAATASG
jgi:hypothetical protein